MWNFLLEIGFGVQIDPHYRCMHHENLAFPIFSLFLIFLTFTVNIAYLQITVPLARVCLRLIVVRCISSEMYKMCDMRELLPRFPITLQFDIILPFDRRKRDCVICECFRCLFISIRDAARCGAALLLLTRM